MKLQQNATLWQVSWEGDSNLPVIGRRNWGICRSNSSWFIDLSVEPIKGVIIRGSCRVITMTSMPWKRGWPLGRRGVSLAVLNSTVRRWLRQRLWHWTHIMFPEGLYSGIVWVCIVILNIWICQPDATLLVSGRVLSQLRVPCLDSDRKIESLVRHQGTLLMILLSGVVMMTYSNSYSKETSLTSQEHYSAQELWTLSREVKRQ